MSDACDGVDRLIDIESNLVETQFCDNSWSRMADSDFVVCRPRTDQAVFISVVDESVLAGMVLIVTLGV